MKLRKASIWFFAVRAVRAGRERHVPGPDQAVVRHRRRRAGASPTGAGPGQRIAPGDRATGAARACLHDHRRSALPALLLRHPGSARRRKGCTAARQSDLVLGRCDCRPFQAFDSARRAQTLGRRSDEVARFQRLGTAGAQAGTGRDRGHEQDRTEGIRRHAGPVQPGHRRVRVGRAGPAGFCEHAGAQRRIQRAQGRPFTCGRRPGDHDRPRTSAEVDSCGRRTGALDPAVADQHGGDHRHGCAGAARDTPEGTGADSPPWCKCRPTGRWRLRNTHRGAAWLRRTRGTGSNRELDGARRSKTTSASGGSCSRNWRWRAGRPRTRPMPSRCSWPT